MICRISVPRILNRLSLKGGDIPTGPRVKRLECVESEGNVWGRASGHEPSCPKTHSEAANTQREAFVILQPRNHINKRKLQVYGVVLNWRCWPSVAFYCTRKALRQKTQTVPPAHIGQHCHPVRHIKIETVC